MKAWGATEGALGPQRRRCRRRDHWHRRQDHHVIRSCGPASAGSQSADTGLAQQSPSFSSAPSMRANVWLSSTLATVCRRPRPPYFSICLEPREHQHLLLPLLSRHGLDHRRPHSTSQGCSKTLEKHKSAPHRLGRPRRRRRLASKGKDRSLKPGQRLQRRRGALLRTAYCRV
jgi:hypothetical protein